MRASRVAGCTVAIALLASASLAAAKPRLVVSAPDTVIADGESSVDLIVRIEPASAVAKVQSIDVQASAGTVGDAKPAANDGVGFPFTPPRLAADAQVTLVVVAKLGKRSLRKKLELQATAPTASVATARTKGAFDLQTPERVRLGRDATVEISIASQKGPPPSLFASVGTLSELVDDRAGRLRATYTPPKSGAPQLAIVAAVSANRKVVDWARVPLVGQGKLKLRSEPSASVVIRVGAIDFGPVRTDRKGKASLVVEAPPGVTTATTIATDQLGNVKRGSLPLKPPPFNRILTVCPDRGSRTLFLVVDDKGAPAGSATVEPTVSVGSLSKPAVGDPGIFAAEYSIDATATFGESLIVQAGLAGVAGSDGSCFTTIPGEAVSSVRVSFEADGYTAGSGNKVTVVVEVDYPGKLPPIEATVAFAADLGDVGKPTRESPARFTATWTVPDRFEGRTSAVVTAKAGDSVTSTGTLALRAGPLAELDASISQDKLLGDGKSAATISVRARDAHGNPVTEAALAATARGGVGPFEASEPGRFAARYVAPVAHEAGRDTIEVRGGSVSDSTSILLRAVRPALSVSATVGYLTNFGKVAAPTATAELSYRLPFGGQRFSVGVEAGFYSSGDTSVVMAEEVETNVTGVPLLARVSYALPVEPAALYLAVAGGAVLAEREVASPTGGRVVHGGARPAVSGALGGELRLGPGRAVLEGGYLYAPIDDEEISGNAGGLRITAGYRYDL